ncbi:hypothetical protein CHREV_290 [Choristoneura rosaceana entomopoxvirus 'L']|uniref:Uncharacterized protein n=1 Tax=Choristoneura rosaceana entomopoxvirus 'L' TaxID=1293539 RepID=A0ABM9QK41_9POXV|nr:hypothetical protein CHREV_007 [Choristoneura rosaceana entomopoxvirus 'L']YP_008004694.1 hypothetical protein CHREV_290 [Choristoneura rosaceana entomopoxvirus 'L']CCU55909.1 hypothetical protein CHREV_007 [Choristoneura rosaceana entomopoxvirus 'L']CCU56192.1 hypothetical protein CHREV_290 [Choristoneura rosaceana entomopoxvirus 'L']
MKNILNKLIKMDVYNNSVYDLYIFLNNKTFASIDDVNNFIKNTMVRFIAYIIKEEKYIIRNEKNEYEYTNKIMKSNINYIDNNSLKSMSLYDIASNENYVGRYNDIAFKPCEIIKDKFNLWSGIKSKKTDNISENIYKLINFIKENICNDDESKFNFLISWFKDVIMYGKKTNKHIIFYSKSLHLYNISYILKWITNNVIGEEHAKYIASNNIKFKQKFNNILLYCLNFYIKKYKYIYDFINKNDKAYNNFIIVTDNIDDNINDDKFIIFELDINFIMATDITLDNSNSDEFYTYLFSF